VIPARKKAGEELDFEPRLSYSLNLSKNSRHEISLPPKKFLLAPIKTRSHAD
jgi:hypothetical protein